MKATFCGREREGDSLGMRMVVGGVGSCCPS